MEIKPLPIEVTAWQTRDLGIAGEQHVYRFDNGYGASVVQGPYTYGGRDGKYELAVIAFTGDTWDLTYATPVTDNVIGYLTVPEVAGLLVQIAALPSE
jgi:hypothetical protein